MLSTRWFLLTGIVFAIVMTAPHAVAQPASGERIRIFCFDAANMSKEHQAGAISAAELMIQRKAGADDRIAVMVSEGAGKVIVKQDFTRDHNRVLEAVRHIVDNPAGTGDGNIVPSLAATLVLVKPMPGQKALYYFSRTVNQPPSQAEWQSVRDRAAASRTEVYVIETPGAPGR